MSKHQLEEASQVWRILSLAGICAIFFLVLVGFLFWLQVVEIGKYQEKEELQTRRRILLPAPRGEIFDREGKLLVGNQSRHSAVIFLDQIREDFRIRYLGNVRNIREIRDSLPEAASLEFLTNLLGEPGGHWQEEGQDLYQFGQFLTAVFKNGQLVKTRINNSELQWESRMDVIRQYVTQINSITGRNDQVSRKKFERHFNRKLLLPFTLVQKLTAEEYARLIDQLPLDSPIQIHTDSTRYYPFHSAASHTLGYVVFEEVEDQEHELLAGENLKTFRLRGKKGKTGLEYGFNDRLDGVPGYEIWRVDPMGFQFELEEKKQTEPGENLFTSIDIDLQMLAELQLEGKKAAVVAMDVQTGEILAMASKPDYNLNDLTPYIPADVYRRVEAQGGWLNRCTQGLYPPGSTFKILTTIAGMRSGVIKDVNHYQCRGAEDIGRRPFPCHNPRGHLDIDIERAIALSCNTFYYHFGVGTGIDILSKEARRFGFDEPTGIEIPYESQHTLIPDKPWKLEKKGEPWRPGDTANFSIGQGYILVTPLQMACFTASVARRETHTKPTIIRIPEAQRNSVDHGGGPIGITDMQYQLIVSGMEKAVEYGTAQLCKIPGIDIAAKTGTAQVRDSDRNSPTFGEDLTLAWFIGFAPVSNPSIAIAVVVEGTDPNDNYHGGTTAAPIARNLFWVHLQKKARRELSAN
jgi:penicillin-binding protein 2